MGLSTTSNLLAPSIALGIDTRAQCLRRPGRGAKEHKMTEQVWDRDMMPEEGKEVAKRSDALAEEIAQVVSRHSGDNEFVCR
jgi:hypothetical protein